MRKVSQRDLRKESAAIMDAVAAGETVVVTRRGVPFAELRPLPAGAEVSRDDLYRRLGRMPAGDHGAQRAEADAFFGDDDRLDD